MAVEESGQISNRRATDDRCQDHRQHLNEDHDEESGANDSSNYWQTQAGADEEEESSRYERGNDRRDDCWTNAARFSSTDKARDKRTEDRQPEEQYRQPDHPERSGKDRALLCVGCCHKRPSP